MRLLIAFPAAALLSALFAASAQAARIRHELEVTLLPGTNEIVVVDTVTFTNPEGFSGTLPVYLHGGLELETAPLAGMIERVERKIGPGHPLYREGRPAQEIRLRPAGGWPWRTVLVFKARGRIHDRPEEAPENYAGGLRETSGIVSVDGVALSGESLFYPVFPQPTADFRMAVRMPGGWDAVSQGRRLQNDRGPFDTYTVWESTLPAEEIHLIAAPFTEYGGEGEDPVFYAFLRSPDPALARKFETITETYIDMYSELIGPYPYPKFALVENFWETGYGMPSFTLLGPKVIRLPFLPHTSYPHEILHNWWGNGVFVDPEHGNWSEGLTAYLADHLLKEAAGQGSEYRRDALKSYADFVRESSDFPLARFTARRTSASEAVGYGKSSMIFHMLRRKLGDAAFVAGLRAFFAERRFKRASFADLGAVFERSSGVPLKDFFNQWVGRTGAPELRLSGAKVRSAGGKTILTLSVEQEQAAPAFRLDIPAAVSFSSGGRAGSIVRVLSMSKKKETFTLEIPGEPLSVRLDPGFDAFRRLDALESPPAIGSVLGSEKILIVTPAAEPDARLRAAYEDAAESWRRRAPESVVVVTDADFPHPLPEDRAAWFFGRRNRYAAALKPRFENLGLSLGPSEALLPGESVPLAGHSFVFVCPGPGASSPPSAWLFADDPAAMPGLLRKFPHYSKFGWLAFRGDAPAVVSKGAWPARGGSLSRNLKPGAPPPVIAPSKPLTAPKQSFSAGRLRADVGFLTSRELDGRAAGSPGLDLAATYIAAMFRLASLEHPTEEMRFTQNFSLAPSTGNTAVPLTNVIGVYPGENPALRDQAVVVSAHYDHLGAGLPGADDNASGVAVLLELARALKKTPPERTVLFAAFTAGTREGLGARYFLAHSTPVPSSAISAVIDLRSVGRLRADKFSALGAASSESWTPLLMSASQASGVDILPVPLAPPAGGAAAFLAEGIPAIRLTTGESADAGGPRDTKESLDYDGMARVAAFAAELINGLAASPRPLRFSPGARPRAARMEGRRASLGAVPDFLFPGPGVRLREVPEGSSADAAGLTDGDIVTALNGRPVSGVAEYSRALKDAGLGARVTVSYERDGVRGETIVAVTER